MAKTKMKVAPAVETLKPYLDRALNDKDVRDDLMEAISAAKQLYGPLAKTARKKGAVTSASLIATDAKVHENLRRTLEDFGKAAESLKGQKKKTGHKKRNTVLLAGVAAGALYNPWSGPQTRTWLMDKTSRGNDRWKPLADDLAGEAKGFASSSSATINKAGDDLSSAAQEFASSSAATINEAGDDLAGAAKKSARSSTAKVKKATDGVTDGVNEVKKKT